MQRRTISNGFCGTAAAIAVLCAPLTLGADTLELTGVVRDFKRGDWSGGHPDFQTAGAMNRFGLVHGMVTMTLSDDGKPVYNPVRPAKDTMHSAASLNQWYRDVPGVNVSVPLTITLDNGQDEVGGVYTFHNNNFFPINNQLFGNEGLNHNYHFTFELRTQFTYEPGQRFTFIGDDDVWVYVKGVRVIDIGGVHSAETASFLLFDGKAFVEKNHFPTGGMVQVVSSSMAADLARKWNNLELQGNCPVKEGNKFIDLNITGDRVDVRGEFNGSSVLVAAAESLTRVTLKFEDGTTERFDDLAVGTSHTFTGTGIHANKQVVGLWLKTTEDPSPFAQYISDAGGSGIDAQLDFFFAERHTTQSNFRIDTSIRLRADAIATVAPMYD